MQVIHDATFTRRNVLAHVDTQREPDCGVRLALDVTSSIIRGFHHNETHQLEVEHIRQRHQFSVPFRVLQGVALGLAVILVVATQSLVLQVIFQAPVQRHVCTLALRNPLLFRRGLLATTLCIVTVDNFNHLRPRGVQLQIELDLRKDGLARRLAVTAQTHGSVRVRATESLPNEVAVAGCKAPVVHLSLEYQHKQAVELVGVLLLAVVQLQRVDKLARVVL